MGKRIAEAKIGEVMSHEVITVSEATSIRELKAAFVRHDFNAFPVVRGDKVVGIVTKLDLMKAFTPGVTFSRGKLFDLWARTVGDVMRRAVVSVGPEDMVERAVEFMVEFKLRSLPVLEHGRLVGIVSRTDVLPYLESDEE